MYRLITYRRQPGELVIELQRHYRSLRMIPTIIGAVLFFFLLMILMAMSGPFGFLFWCFGMFCFDRFYRIRVFLCYDAATLRVIYRRDLVFTEWYTQLIYNRADVPSPVTWIHAVPPNTRRSFRLDEGIPAWTFRFQTRFPFLSQKTQGVICTHATEERMLTLFKVVDDFLAETPYDKTLFEQTEAALSTQGATRKTIVKSQKRERKQNAAQFDETKRYAFDRGESPLRRGDEPVGKGEPTREKKPTRHKSYAFRRHSMVKIEEEVSVDLSHGTLKLVSTTGGFLSASLATLSVLFFYAAMITWGIGGFAYIAMQLTHWEQLERHFFPLAEQVFVRLPEEYHEPAGDAVRWYIDASRGGEDQLGAIVVTVVAWLVMLVMLIGIGQFVRWPFWRRWTVILKNQPSRPWRVLFSWKNDRVHSREPEKHIRFFFCVIPATPKTNRLLTGRSWFSNNPGWKQPHQVVLVTGEGSFPLPCGSPEEQEQIVERITRFHAEC